MILIPASSYTLIFNGAGMKKGLSYCTKCVCFFVILALLISSAYNALKWKDTTGEYLSSVEQLYSTPEGLIDVVFVGSSHCYFGIQPAVLWEKYGIASFDMSVSSQDKNSAYHDLIELYKTQNPSVIYVDLHALSYDKQLVVSNVYRNYLSLKTSPNSIALVNKYVEEEDREAFYLRFPIIHTRYRELQKNDFVEYAPNSFGRGEYITCRAGESWLDLDIVNDPAVGDLSEKNREWLENMIALAEEHNSRIEFIVIPFPVGAEEQAILNAAEEMLAKENYAYTDYNRMTDQLGMDFQKDFADAEHLNVYGAQKLTSLLGEELVKKYDLPDHRGDERYWQWDTDLKWYENTLACQRMSETVDPREYVSVMTDLSDCITLVSLDGDFLNSEIDYFEVLEPLGMNYEEYRTGGKWIYRDGRLEKISENRIGAETYYDFSRYDRIKIAYEGPMNPENIAMGRKTYQGSSPLTFATYDTILEKMAVCRQF